MSRYVDAEKIPYSDFDLPSICTVLKNIAYKKDIDKIPTADVAPIINAHWIGRMFIEIESTGLLRNDRGTKIGEEEKEKKNEQV